jgi:cobalt-zinc-cadmium resistance protein CzcA
VIAALIELAMRRWWVVLFAVIAIIGAGVYAFKRQPVDAYPDISSISVQIITTYPGRAPEEVERRVTIPIENAMLGAPKVRSVRSGTIFGLSVITMVFEEGTELYWARQRVSEKLNDVDLPDGVKPQLGPPATAYGEVYRYRLVSDGTHDLIELRELNDWVVTRRLLRVPGVAECANFGGYEKQLAVTFFPAQLDRFGVTFSDVEDAIKKNNTAAGGSVVRRGSMALVVRGQGLVEDPRQVEGIFIKSVAGTPVYLRDIAAVGRDSKVPNGIFSKDRVDESVEGIVTMRRGENPSQVLERVQAAVKELNETAALPPGVQVVSFYDRQHLVDSTLETVSHSVLLGITLVVLVLLLFLGRPATAFLVALTIPFALLFALLLMYVTDIPIGLLSIGAIDFGIIVDGAVIVAENIARRLGAATLRTPRPNVYQVVLAASREMERPVFFSVLMVGVAYLPLLSLTSIEGLLFRPMALTMVYALAGSLLFALFVIPALAVLLFRNGYHEWENPLLRWSRPVYALTLRALFAVRWFVVSGVVIGVTAVVVLVGPRLGFEFLPYMDEGTIWVRANFPEGSSLEQTSAYGRRLREIAAEFPDIRFATVQAGRNDDGTDPFPPSRVEMMIGPKKRSEWTQFRTKQQLLAALGKRYREEFPTTRFNFTQPIIDNVTEDTNGTSANLAVEFTGPDSEKLLELARRTADLLKTIPGNQDVAIEQEGPQPQLVIQPDRQLCARYNVRIEDVAKLVNMAIGGEPVGTQYQADRKFDIVARLDRQTKDSVAAIGRLPVYTAEGLPVPLFQVAKIEVMDGQTLIAREGGRRRITVRCDIVGRDQGGFVSDAQAKFEVEIAPLVPPGYRVGWLGMFENLARARTHFAYLIPLTVAILFGLLLVTFGSIRAALLVLMGIPFACIGGVLALYIRGMHANVSTGVGFCALFGIAIMDGVLMVRGITVLREHGMALRDAIVQGAQERLRPILMTAIVAILGLLPASLATGLGSDVQRPLATVIVWGLFSSTALTLFVVPVLYYLFAPGITPNSGPPPDGSAH